MSDFSELSAFEDNKLNVLPNTDFFSKIEYIVREEDNAD